MPPLQTSPKHWLEFIPILILAGVLAGAIGGLAIGLVMSHTTTTSVAQ